MTNFIITNIIMTNVMISNAILSTVITTVVMEQRCALKNVNNCLNTDIYSYLRTPGG